MPEVAVNGITIAYEDAGAGSPLLLIHGGLGTAALHWWRELPVFSRRHRVIAPDLRGYGRSSPPRRFPRGFYLQDADDLAALLTSVGDVPAHVIGWSDGGIVALALAVRHPRLVRSLVVISGQARLLEQERAGWHDLVDVARWPPGALRRFVDAQGPSNWPAIFARMVAGYSEILDRDGGEIVATRIHEIRCPTLIVHGDADPTVPIAHAHELHAAIAGSRLHLVQGGGHMPQREHPAEFQELVLAFLSENDR